MPRLGLMRLPRLPWKGFLAGCFLLCFFAGILTANWVGQEKLLQYGMLNQYYVGQLAYAELDCSAYFLFLLKKRMKIFGMTALFSYTRFGVLVLPGVIGWYAFSLGYLFVNALVCMKFQGMLLVLLSIFPQILLYAAAYFGQKKRRCFPFSPCPYPYSVCLFSAAGFCSPARRLAESTRASSPIPASAFGFLPALRLHFSLAAFRS